jgi:acyl transferase domain-containing protein
MTQRETKTRPPLAIVGVSALFPGSTNAGGFWRDILAGKDLLTDVPETHWLAEDYYDEDPAAPDKTYASRGGFLPEIDFDALHWGVPPSIIEATDTSQLLALILAERVLKDASNGQFETMDRSRISCILGVTSAQELLGTMVSRLQHPIWRKSLREHGLPEDEVEAIVQRIGDHYVPWQESSFPGLLGNVVAGRIANRLDLGGTNCVTDAACASTFSALSMAVRELYLGDSDLVITGGVDTLNDIFMYMCFSKTPALSRTGDCRPFSDQADGTMLGEGLGMVAIKRLDDAERDGDRIYAVLSGVGSSSDGRSKSVYAPVKEGQANAIRRAYENAGFSPDTVELMEAHGTGTKAGDAAEFGGLSMVFGNGTRTDHQWCALGSVKSQIGHTKAASGAAGLFKALMALHHKVLPPTIKVDRPNEALDLENSPFFINTASRPWIRGSDHPRRAGVSSFGFGGSNFHLALEEYHGDNPHADRVRALSAEVVALSGADGASIATRALELADLATAPGMLQRIAWECAQSYEPAALARLAVVAADEADLASKLRRLADIIAKAPATNFAHPDGSAYGVGAPAGDVAFLFPGQGSQYLGMGSDVAMAFDVARGPWDRAADLDLGADQRIDQVVFPISRFDENDTIADEELLRATEWAQPAIGATSLSLLSLMNALGVRAAAVAGHSFGEITALHAAGVLTEADMLRVARRRGELMAAAAELPGAMTAVSTDIERVGALLGKLDASQVVIANHNAPTQVVISGTVDGIEAAEALLQADEIRFQRLDVATAFHSPVVASSEAPFGAFLSDVPFSEADIPVWSGELAAPYDPESTNKRKRLAQQIANPVRFVDMVRGMADAGIRTFIEVGPGSVLTSLVDRTLEDLDHQAIALDRRGKDGVVSLSRGIAQLVAAGVSLDFGALWQGYGEPEDIGKRTQPRLAVPISGVNHGKAYPPKGGAAALPGPNPPRPPARQSTVQSTPMAAAQTASTPPRSAVAPAPVLEEAPMTSQTPPPVALSDGWLAAWQEALRQNAVAHTAFQQAMTQSHTAYLNVMETSIASLASLAGGTAPTMLQRAPLPVAQPVAPLPAMPPVVAPVAPAHTPAPEPPVTAPTAAPQTAPAISVVAERTLPMADAPPTLDLHTLMLDVVAAKTGYPAEMLDLGMNLEGDLGIDSIKRVEILAAVQDQAPGMPEVDAAHMGALKTLGEIVGYMQGLMGDTPATAAAALPAAAAPPVAGVDLHALMLTVVAEKTGYPAEMLDLEMNLEGDLGIDSIKRVEILAAVQDQAPGMPEVDAAHMGALKTLGEIVGYMQGLMGDTPATAASSLPAAAAPPVVGVDLHALMLTVVAEKTGYPAEMLDVGMNLEGDLGIDSIKRVEILAAVQDQAPGMPEVDAAHMGALKTLGEIVEYMQGLMGGAQAPPTTVDATPAIHQVTSGKALGRYSLELVPSPALGLAQPALRGAPEVLVTSSGTGLSDILVDELKGRGINAIAVDTVPADAQAVVFLGGLRPVTDVDAAIAVSREAFAIARTLAPTLTQGDGLFVTVQDTGGAFGTTPFPAERAYLAGIPALVKTAVQEWPKASLKAIDLACGDRDDRALATALADELLLGGGETEVGLGVDGLRISPRSVLAPCEKGEHRIGQGDVVVVSGGGRGVTAACVVEWARDTGARFLLLGRSALAEEPTCCAGAATDPELKRALLDEAKKKGEKLSPAVLGKQVRDILASREIRQTLAAIEAVGGQARYRSASVTDPQAIGAVLEETRADWGPVKALIHGAGVLADRKIADQTDEQFDVVFNTKVEGLRVLLAALSPDPLRVLCLFSSVSARCGNNGQSAYAMANEVLNKVAWAESRARGGDVLVKSLGWGPWEGGMVTPQLRAHFEKLGVPMIPLDVGARMFADELHGANPDQVEIVLGGEPRPEALLAVGSEARCLRLEVTLNRQTHAYLAGHSIGGEVVVPVVLVLEWFNRVARAFRSDLHVGKIQNLNVLKGVQLRDFDGSGQRLILSCRQLSNGHGALLDLALESPSGLVHYRAQAQMVENRPTVAKSEPPSLALNDWGGAPIYGDVLFHTDEFQVIQALDGMSDDGISGTLNGVGEAKWGWEHWNTDVAAMDGGLQLVLLWARSNMGGAVLPMSIGEIRMSTETPPQGPIQCVARCRAASKNRGVADIVFYSESGDRFAELKDVEVILRPDGAKT